MLCELPENRCMLEGFNTVFLAAKLAVCEKREGKILLSGCQQRLFDFSFGAGAAERYWEKEEVFGCLPGDCCSVKRLFGSVFRLSDRVFQFLKDGFV